MTGSILFAQEVQEAPKPDKDKKDEQPPGWFQMAPFILIAFVWIYFMIIVPNRREKQRQAALMGGLKKNDEVVTSSGILGIVTSIKDTGDEVTIKSDETRLRVLKSSIVRIINAKETPAAPAGQDQAVTDLSNKGKA